MKPTDIAYIAGLIDGEGYIGIKRSINRANHCINYSYQERIQIRMVDEQAIAFIAYWLGGSYYRESRPEKNRRQLYCYQASDRIAHSIIKTLLPYLKVKRAVAEVVLGMRPLKEHPEYITVDRTIPNRWGKTVNIGRRQYSPAHVAKMHALYERCKELNRVGTAAM